MTQNNHPGHYAENAAGCIHDVNSVLKKDESHSGICHLQISFPVMASPTLLDACCPQEIPCEIGLSCKRTYSSLPVVNVQALDLSLHLLKSTMRSAE